MQNVFLLVHLLLTLSLIVVVLLQRSEGGGLGMGGGGPAGTGRAAATGLGKLTWILGISLFATSIALTIIAAQNSAGSSVLDRLIDLPPPSAEDSAPADGGLGDSLLPPTPGNDTNTIMAALDRLSAGGSTNGGQGIQLAYATARKNFRKAGINRVILATDGDFNVGTTNQGDLIRMIEREREDGIFLTVLGFGSGNYKDSTMEKLANKGNGNYAYIDNISEARKVLVNEAGATLVTVAKDVKLQLEFNPRKVAAYRLIGYENRMLRAEDFNNDKKDAGEIGAGHSVTALYEIVPAGKPVPAGGVDPLKYQTPGEATAAADSSEWLTVKIRYKQPQGSTSSLLSYAVTGGDTKLAETSANFRFSAAVAAFGMLLRDSEHKGQASYSMVRDLAQKSLGTDEHGYRGEFLRLVSMARDMGERTN